MANDENYRAESVQVRAPADDIPAGQAHGWMGLTVRWSLADADQDALELLRDYVETKSYDRFRAKEGLRFKTWRARAGEWFEGCYVFASSEERDAFQTEFAAAAADAPASRIIGAPPVLIEPCEVVAVAEGAAGFRAAASYRRAG